MGRFSRQKTSKDIVSPNIILNQLALIDIYRIPHPTTEYTYFSSSHGTFANMDYIQGHKTHLNKYKIEITQSMFSDHSRPKLEINYRKITGNPNMFRLD